MATLSHNYPSVATFHILVNSNQNNDKQPHNWTLKLKIHEQSRLANIPEGHYLLTIRILSIDRSMGCQLLYRRQCQKQTRARNVLIYFVPSEVPDNGAL